MRLQKQISWVLNNYKLAMMSERLIGCTIDFERQKWMSWMLILGGGLRLGFTDGEPKWPGTTYFINPHKQWLLCKSAKRLDVFKDTIVLYELPRVWVTEWTFPESNSTLFSSSTTCAQFFCFFPPSVLPHKSLFYIASLSIIKCSLPSKF